MNTQQTRELGGRIAGLVESDCIEDAYRLLAPVLAERTRFALLDRIGAAAGAGYPDRVNSFLARIAGDQTEGGWVVIGAALGEQLDRDPQAALDRCRDTVVAADTWYGADILGERVPGPALVADFEPALDRLAPWRSDSNRWVRRTLGVAVHFWAKRSRGAAELAGRAALLLDFLDPLFEEWDMDALKGIGWGLKTLGRYYPQLTAGWLRQQVVVRNRRHRSLMLRKALTYMPDEQRAHATRQ